VQGDTSTAAVPLGPGEAALAAIDHIDPDLARRAAADPGLLAALGAVVAASPWLATVCTSDPLAADVLADLDGPEPAFPPAGPYTDIRRRKELGVLRIAARDLLGRDDVAEVGRRLSRLAEEVVAEALAWAPGQGEGLAVIGLGKLGAGELNYASDIDLVLVRGDGEATDPRPFLELARSAWKVDLGLRPEGRAGPLARSLGSYEAYWSRWAEAWEFQALLKARPVGGDGGLGAAFCRRAAAQVWGREFGGDDLRRLRDMKNRAESELARRGLEDREIKRGRGGIRDIEFAVQLLQLVHGRSDESLRVAATLDGLSALAAGGYIAVDDADALEGAYRYLRAVENRLQLYAGQQAHTLPRPAHRRRQLAQAMGYRDDAAASAEQRFEGDLRRHRAAARSIHERLFFRPLLEAFTAGTGASVLSDDAVAERLSAFGFVDATRTALAVTELTRGFSRRSQLMQRMLPLLLDWLSASPDPDQGLLGLRILASGAQSSDRLVSLCRDSPMGARQLCRLLGTGPHFARDLQRQPDSVAGLASGDFPTRRPAGELAEQAVLSLRWRSGQGTKELGLRQFAQAERLRIAARDVLGMDDTDATGGALSDLADAVVAAAVAEGAAAVPLAVMGLGRLGGREIGYGSDLDLLMVTGPPGGGGIGPAEAAAAVVRLIAGSSPATGAYRVDLNLRPEGRHGATVRSLDSYAAYYERWAQPWERQALLRTRFVAGDAALGAAFLDLAARHSHGAGLGRSDLVEIRRTKARMERERVPAGEDPKYHLKLGPGSITDVEWTVQLLQLRHGLAGSGTMEALGALRSAGVVAAADADALAAAYRWCVSARNRLSLIRDIPSASLPVTGPVLTVLARSLGESPAELRNTYSRLTRRARRVVERLFYGS
jgi:glutamate-ammonia-ligase adenylyltransferase